MRLLAAFLATLYLLTVHCGQKLLDKNGTADETELCFALFLGPSIMDREGFLLLLLPQEYNGVVAVPLCSTYQISPAPHAWEPKI